MCTAAKTGRGEAESSKLANTLYTITFERSILENRLFKIHAYVALKSVLEIENSTADGADVVRLRDMFRSRVHH